MSTIETRPSAPGGFATDDLEHLRLLAVFHYVVGGMFALVALFPSIHLVLGVLMATGQLAPEDEGSEVFGWFMSGCAAFIMVVGLCFAALVLYAGRCLALRRGYTLCLVVAALLCMFMPFGTVLGIFTIIVLLRPTVRTLFGVEPPTASATA